MTRAESQESQTRKLQKPQRCPSCGGLCDQWPKGEEGKICYGCQIELKREQARRLEKKS